VAALLGLVLAAAAPSARAAALPHPPTVTARAAVVLDLDTGLVLYAKRPAVRLYPASTTKILTAYIVLTHLGDLDRPVRVPPDATGLPGSTVGLVPGEVETPRALLYGMMLVSGNDAAVALADITAGSSARFVALMNATAHRLGATESRFANPDGLPDPRHVVTALDLARIARAALALPAFRRLVATRSYLFPAAHGPVRIWNENRLLWTYPGAFGVKTGYTVAAGETLVAAARRGGVAVVVVLLHATPSGLWTDAEHLLDYGFAVDRPHTLARRGQVVARAWIGGRQVPLAAAAPLTVPLPSGDRASLRLAVRLDRGLTLPVARGARVGRLVAVVAGRPVRAVPLVAASAVAPPRPWWMDVLILAGVFLGLRLLRRERRRVPRRRLV
jgi:D-alanyl-D-alanine carboxypeptidase (penicillin-binding protein 5/6)